MTKLIDRLGRTGDDYLGKQSLDIQAAKAMINKADALEHLGDAEATIATCDLLLSRFTDSVSDEMNSLKSTARDIKNDYKKVKTIAPGSAPFSALGAKPSTGGVPPWTPRPIGVPKP